MARAGLLLLPLGCAHKQTRVPASAPAAVGQAPLAPRKPFTVTSPNGDREDDWYWLRDDTRKDPEILAYLGAENAWYAKYRDAPRRWSSQSTVKSSVPFVDVVTTMLDESIPLTTNEFDEWGNLQQNAAYDDMLSYSPIDNVSAQDYPAMLVITGLWDSPVQYFEPAKWVARLRATKTDDRPLLFKIDMEAGHGGKSGRLQRCLDTAESYAFVLDQLGVAH